MAVRELAPDGSGIGARLGPAVVDALVAGGLPVPVGLRGRALLGEPLLNKDSAFDEAERDAFGLRGLLPARVATLEEQVVLELEHVRRKPDALERYIGLAALEDRNETLFFRLLTENLEEFLPIVYTPTVGRACEEFSHIVRRPRGLWITPDDVGRIRDLLRDAARGEIRLIVATDNERILGLGDQGAGGMGIPVGKLALYTAAAGIHPARTLPVSLDVGTDREDLLADPLYMGWRGRRLRGAEYDAVVEAFVEAVLDVFPHAILQWEDFKQHVALRLLDRYRHRIASFNDDVQGTGATALAGILAGVRHLGRSLVDERFLLVGAGAAGIGIARLLVAALAAEGVSPEAARARVTLLDSCGVVHAGRSDVADDKRPFARSVAELAACGLAGGDADDRPTLAAVVAALRPTVLVGTTGVAGCFDEPAIRALADGCDRPIVLALSNPTTKVEASPANVLAWTGGRALVAAGSPFDPVATPAGTRLVGQANNVFVFPGVGLGAIVADARALPDGVFLRAARTLAGFVDDARLDAGALYPPAAALRSVARAVAIEVVRECAETGYGRPIPDALAPEAVDRAMWEPTYASYAPDEATVTQEAR